MTPNEHKKEEEEESLAVLVCAFWGWMAHSVSLQQWAEEGEGRRKEKEESSMPITSWYVHSCSTILLPKIFRLRVSFPGLFSCGKRKREHFPLTQVKTHLISDRECIRRCCQKPHREREKVHIKKGKGAWEAKSY